MIKSCCNFSLSINLNKHKRMKKVIGKLAVVSVLVVSFASCKSGGGSSKGGKCPAYGTIESHPEVQELPVEIEKI